MSKQAQYEVQLKEVNKEYLKEAVGRMCNELDIPIVRKNTIKIGYENHPVKGTCIKLPQANYAADIYADNGRVIINTDSEVVRQYHKYDSRIKQFYEATELAKEFNTEFEYNKETEKIELQVYA